MDRELSAQNKEIMIFFQSKTYLNDISGIYEWRNIIS